jgi:ribose-phosphate pyrophosphokinase
VAQDSVSIEDVRIFSGSANLPLAEAVASHLGIQLSPLIVTRLPDSEVHIQVEELVRHQDVFIIQPCSMPVNDNLVELLLMVDAFRRASARRTNVVMSYFPYCQCRHCVS